MAATLAWLTPLSNNSLSQLFTGVKWNGRLEKENIFRKAKLKPRLKQEEAKLLSLRDFAGKVWGAVSKPPPLSLTGHLNRARLGRGDVLRNANTVSHSTDSGARETPSLFD